MYLDRTEARSHGARYYQGTACSLGHDGLRYVGSGACRECGLLNERARRASRMGDALDRERARKRAAQGRWKREDRDKKRARGKRYRAELAQRPEAVLRRQRAAAARVAQQARKDRAAAEREAKRAARQAARPTAEQIRERKLQRDRMKAKRRRAVKRGAATSVTDADVAGILELQGGGCAYCGTGKDLHLDHKTAISRGGAHELGNLQWLCAGHNMAKRARSDMEYRAAAGIPKLTPWDGPIGRLAWGAVLLV